MNFALTEEQKILQEMAKNFAENEIKPHVEEDEKNQYWRKGIFDKMAELGFGFCIDEKYGGNGMGFLEGVPVIEQIAKVHTSWRMAFNMQCWGHRSPFKNSVPRNKNSTTFPNLSAANTSAVSR